MPKILLTTPNFQLFEQEPETYDLQGNKVELPPEQPQRTPYHDEIDGLLAKGINSDKIKKAISTLGEQSVELNSYLQEKISNQTLAEKIGGKAIENQDAEIL